MLNLLIVVCIQFIIMLLELKNMKVLSQELKCFYSKTTTVLWE